MNIIDVDLSRITQTERLTTEERTVGLQAGGLGKVKREHLMLNHCEIQECSSEQLVLKLLGSDASIETTLKLLGLPASIKGYHYLELDVIGATAAMFIEFQVIGARSRLIKPVMLGAEEKKTIIIDLQDLPLTAGKQAAYEPPALRIAALWGMDPMLTDYDRARRFGNDDTSVLGELPVRHEDERTLTVTGLRLIQDPSLPELRPVADGFGQRLATTWPGKVKSVEQLKAYLEAEKKELDTLSETPGRNRYGSYVDGPKFEGTGYFHVACENGIWWMVDPEGYAFYSQGVTGVRSWDNTLTDGREELFEKLPQEADPLYKEVINEGEDHYTRGLKFYGWNILRKYGSREAWRDHVCARFKKWGLNSIANWSEEVMFDQDQVPFTLTSASRDPSCPVILSQLNDVFDEGFIPYLEERFEREMGHYRENPMVLGVFVDNEASWNAPRLLDGPEDRVMRDHWLELVKSYCSDDLTKASTIFGKAFSDWTEVRNLKHDPAFEEGEALELYQQLRIDFAHKYFGGIRQAIKKVLPNHMYLGCRFVRNVYKKPWVLSIAGEYVDAMSVNTYDLYPRIEQMRLFWDLGKKPVMIGEHHFPLRSDRQLPPLYPAFTTHERRKLYPYFSEQWARQPWAIGDHWYQHADQAVTGRGLDGENQLVGFVDVTDRPHEELVESAQYVARNLLEWKLNPVERCES